MNTESLKLRNLFWSPVSIPLRRTFDETVSIMIRFHSGGIQDYESIQYVAKCYMCWKCVNCIFGLAYAKTPRHNLDCMTPTSKQRNVLNNEAERIYVEKQHFVTQCSRFRMPVCGQYTTGQWRALQLEWLYRTKPEWPIMSGQLHIIILSQWNILHLQTVGCKQRRVSLSWFIYRHFVNLIRWTASSNGDKYTWRLSSVSSLLNTQCFDSWLYSRYQIKYKNYATLRSMPIPHNGHPLAAHINRKCCINLRNIKKNIYIRDLFNDAIRTRYIDQYAIRS
jgi:hypothetical protein